MFNALKGAKKAKYGLKADVGTHNFLSLASFVTQHLGEPDDEKWFIEVRKSMGQCELYIYINDDTMYEQLCILSRLSK